MKTTIMYRITSSVAVLCFCLFLSSVAVVNGDKLPRVRGVDSNQRNAYSKTGRQRRLQNKPNFKCEKKCCTDNGGEIMEVEEGTATYNECVKDGSILNVQDCIDLKCTKPSMGMGMKGMGKNMKMMMMKKTPAPKPKKSPTKPKKMKTKAPTSKRLECRDISNKAKCEKQDFCIYEKGNGCNKGS